jgi:hypothetical protein
MGKHRTVDHLYFQSILSDSLLSIVERSIIWSFCKSLPEPPSQDESEEVRSDTLRKEFMASQVLWSPRGLFDWDDLYRSLDRPLAPPWSNQIRRIVKNFAIAINRMNVLFPAVSRTKNVSYETGYEYKLKHPEVDYRMVTTSDIEVHYGRTGEKLSGSCEMRSAWKFNDLKPRYYYSRGGRSHHLSKYIKPFAVALMDALPITHVNRRRNPASQITIDEEASIVTWDFSAFTTNLSELRYFLDHVIGALEQQPVHDVQVLDYFQGVIDVNPCELLQSYNESINDQDAFTITRVIQHLATVDDIEYTQQNSGMLGVPGNIGFSTACHGAVIATVVDSDGSVCVGDDGLAGEDLDPDDILIPTISRLGSINRAKFSILYPFAPGPMKFMKRGLTRDPPSTIHLNELLNLPAPPFVDEVYGSRTIPPNLTRAYAAKKVATTIGSCLWSLLTLQTTVTPEEVVLLRDYLVEIYRYMQWPVRGKIARRAFLRSTDVHGGKLTVDAHIPPLDYDLLREDWAEVLFARYPEEYVSLPVKTHYYPPTLPHKGDTFYCGEQPIIKVLEDFGLVKSEVMRDKILLDTIDNQRLARQALRKKTDPYMLRVDVLDEIPDKFHTFFTLSVSPDNAMDVSGDI